MVHGSLALRAPVTRSTLVSVVGAAKRRVFDVNLRPPHVDEPAIASAAAGEAHGCPARPPRDTSRLGTPAASEGSLAAQQRAFVSASLPGAWLIKLNDDELPELARMLVRESRPPHHAAYPALHPCPRRGHSPRPSLHTHAPPLPQGLEAGAVGDDAAERASAAQLATATGAAAVCVTRGAKGAALWVAGGEGEGEWSQHSGFAAAVDARDTIGAGDSFLASLILSLLPDEPASPGVRHELDATDALARACAIGAFRREPAAPLDTRLSPTRPRSAPQAPSSRACPAPRQSTTLTPSSGSALSRREHDRARRGVAAAARRGQCECRDAQCPRLEPRCECDNEKRARWA